MITNSDMNITINKAENGFVVNSWNHSLPSGARDMTWVFENIEDAFAKVKELFDAPVPAPVKSEDTAATGN